MSLLLDALKRAEEAKRAKLLAESAPEVQKSASLGLGTPPVSQAARPPDPPVETHDFSLEDYKEYIPVKPKAVKPTAPNPGVGVKKEGAELTIADYAPSPSGDDAANTKPRLSAVTAAPAVASASDSTPAPAFTSTTTSKSDAVRVASTQSRDTAKTVFAAKQTPVAEVGTKKKWLLPVIAVALLAVGGGGWFVWNEVKRFSQPAALNLAARPAPSLPAALPGTGQPGARAPDAAAPVVPAAPVEAPLPPLLPPPAEMAALPKPAMRAPEVAGVRLTEREALAKSLKDAAAAKEAPVRLQLARSIETPVVNAELIEAYGALKNAEYPRARALYSRLVLSEPLNPDAHLGLATVLARGGDSAAAARSYRQVLVIDPRNGAALAGLLAVSDARSPALETELRTLASRHPETSSLHFTLGNLYASERRWIEAQQAYFEAFRLESDNADYIYNLAVSLDQLKQARLSQDYYQKALAAKSRSGGQFDSVVVARRIREIASDLRLN